MLRPVALDSVPGGCFGQSRMKGIRMLRLVYVLRRRPEMTREEFQRYWRENHGPLVASVADKLGIKRYQQVHTGYDEFAIGGDAVRGDVAEPYDGVAELWFDDLASLQANFTSEEGQEAGRLLAEDEAKFIDFSRSAAWLADEHVFVGGQG